MKNAALLIAALLAPFGMPTAGAAPAATSTTSYSQFNFSVIDLTPDDGIAAGFSITRTYAQVSMQIIDSANKYVTLSKYYPDIAHDTASLVHEGKELTVAATDTDSTVSAVIPSAYAPRGRATVASTGTWEFTLAPNSLLVFTGEATLNVGISEVFPNHLGASAELNGRGWLENGTHTEFKYFRTTVNGHDGDFSSGFGMSLSNYSDDSLQGYFKLNTLNFTRVIDAATPPPVPEPTASMMLVSGLVAIAFAVRRRRNSSAA